MFWFLINRNSSSDALHILRLHFDLANAILPLNYPPLLHPSLSSFTSFSFQISSIVSLPSRLLSPQIVNFNIPPSHPSRRWKGTSFLNINPLRSTWAPICGHVLHRLICTRRPTPTLHSFFPPLTVSRSFHLHPQTLSPRLFPLGPINTPKHHL